MAEYELVETFDIDDGSLDDLSPQECFVLGVEWARFHRRITAGEQFSDLCLSDNAQRLSMLAERHRRFVEHHDYSEGWSEIFVGATRF